MEDEKKDHQSQASNQQVQTFPSERLKLMRKNTIVLPPDSKRKPAETLGDQYVEELLKVHLPYLTVHKPE
ncbi:MAG: hypothetical protein NT072_13075 [Deltaproteobacteria bacterium]|nr:hypothetical protein [Deltaproteobacteria bacterium]